MQAVPSVLPPPPLADGSDAPARSEEDQATLVRFQAELEFVQCLANPMYLHELSNQGFFAKPEFVNYLAYLEYWRKPEYVRFIVYPSCLAYLAMLQSELFRARLGDLAFVQDLARIGERHHETWRTAKPSMTIKQEKQEADTA